MELTITWPVPALPGVGKLDGEKGQETSITVNLDQFIENANGHLVWTRTARGFSQECKPGSISLDGTVLVAWCRVTWSGKPDDYHESSLDLKNHFVFTDSGFKPSDPDDISELTAMISSASWMDFTFITQANLSAFLQNPAFKKTVSSIARRAIELANSQANAVIQQMQQMVWRLQTINEHSEQYIQHQVAAVIQSAAETAGAVAAMGKLTMMAAQQKAAYANFAASMSEISPGFAPGDQDQTFGQMGQAAGQQKAAYAGIVSSISPQIPPGFAPGAGPFDLNAAFGRPPSSGKYRG